MTYQTAPTETAHRAFLFDLITGLVLTGFCALTSLDGLSGLALSAALTLPWIFRRSHPLPTLAVATAAAVAVAVFEPMPIFAIVVVPMYVYSFARWSDRNLGRISLGIALVGAVIGPARWLLIGSGELLARAAGMTMTVVACVVTVTLAYVIGRRRFERAERAAAAIEAQIERERLMRAEQEQRARFTVVDERNRIARELHDIVAHSLSVIVVQAEGGRALASKHPERAPEVLGTIADTSRDALQEMRQMVGLLRSGGTPGPATTAQLGDGNPRPSAPDGSTDGTPESYLPTPGLDDLAELIEKTGDQFTLTEYGDRPMVNAGIGLTVYRIVQESLTNVLKHAGQGARAAAGITYASDGIGIRVVDDGGRGGPSTTSDGSGHGLRGMAERLSVHHGTVDAHPRPGGGFEVLAWLPYAEPTRVVRRYPAEALTQRIGEQR